MKPQIQAFSIDSTTLMVEFIHRKYAFKVERNATVSSSSTVKTRNNPSFSNFTVLRLVTGEFTSGVKASRSVLSCFPDLNFKRTEAFALIAIQSSLAKTEKFKVINKNRNLP